MTVGGSESHFWVTFGVSLQKDHKISFSSFRVRLINYFLILGLELPSVSTNAARALPDFINSASAELISVCDNKEFLPQPPNPLISWLSHTHEALSFLTSSRRLSGPSFLLFRWFVSAWGMHATDRAALRSTVLLRQPTTFRKYFRCICFV